ncbi:flagellar biosynthesis anti-sigma factor FlgM [Sulfurospirillum sp. 1612]|uniref:flagellar biosynthesis anti-sigma factor FlgM n=1 Tax=Sulfurospirillum sp. 1612 TaxID=3094835 RepID=UPI002F941413
MISNINATNTAILQNTQNSQEKKGTAQVKENKVLNKVDSIKEQIKNGTYHVDIQKTAQSVFEELI